ncbi:MAG: hypothetical protein FWH04_06920 [Oscillospiraceae bacterium]|nr:hypothetical protein [Oscillospiraceae bacterium]
MYAKGLRGLLLIPPAITAILYAGGYIGQFIGNHAAWQEGGGPAGDGIPFREHDRMPECGFSLPIWIVWDFYLPDFNWSPCPLGNEAWFWGKRRI